ncbi:YtxH domain-containing protein [Sediminibacillus massiliensis]|uniref:YtxH domain-containing protein n=1 Tax=Sediminibacillus massiliensis TaxID=1926277 RepID=UPI0009887470|nr:YtxH domain-containing protein [Sediminibacillus massiliensis]
MSEERVKERLKRKKDDVEDKVQEKVHEYKDQAEDKVETLQNTSNGKFIKGAVLGTMVGAAMSLISSPKSGKEVRGKFKEGYGKTIDKGKQAIEKAESLPEEVELWSVQKTDQLVGKIIEKAEKVKGNISENYEYVEEGLDEDGEQQEPENQQGTGDQDSSPQDQKSSSPQQ